MQREWIDAGYVLLTEGRSPKSSHGLLPAHLVTVSTCLVDAYPDSWALPWVETSLVESRAIQDSLGLEDDEFALLREWVGQALDSGEFGWPNVFFSAQIAREFQARFLRTLKGIRLVGLSLTKEVAEDFLRTEAPQEGYGASGVWTMVARGESPRAIATQLGFDVLGAEFGGSFHTFSCNGLEQDYNDKFGITFNELGLIPEYESAVLAAEYTNRDDTGAEPVEWYPFRVEGLEAGIAG